MRENHLQYLELSQSVSYKVCSVNENN